MSIDLKLTRDTVTPELERLASRQPALKKIMGISMRNTLISHFRAKNARPNRLGGTRTNFWLAVANSCTAPMVGGSGIMVRINHPHVAIHIYGGNITPKKAKMLAIPVTAEAHGKSPRVIKTYGLSGPEAARWGWLSDKKCTMYSSEGNASPKTRGLCLPTTKY